MWFWKSPTQTKLDALIRDQKKISEYLILAAENQANLLTEIASIRHLIHCVLLRIGPGSMSISFTDERSIQAMADIIEFTVTLPLPSAPDVVSRELTVTINDSDPLILPVGPNETVISGLKGPQGATVQLSLVDIDDGGNRSEASTLSSELLDTVPPPQPGTMGVVATGESFPVEPGPSDSE